MSQKNRRFKALGPCCKNNIRKKPNGNSSSYNANKKVDVPSAGEGIDAGVEVHFATENVDMRTVAGRLSADITAVFAAHYSRNLREEVKKGLYGRLKQGFYPLRAPIGHLDKGSAKPKIPDPIRAPLVREAFALYSTGNSWLPELAKEMFRRGLRNHNNGAVTINGLATILKNPFYVGLMRIVKTGQTFEGVHEPVVTHLRFHIQPNRPVRILQLFVDC